MNKLLSMLITIALLLGTLVLVMILVYYLPLIFLMIICLIFTFYLYLCVYSEVEKYENKIRHGSKGDRKTATSEYQKNKRDTRVKENVNTTRKKQNATSKSVSRKKN